VLKNSEGIDKSLHLEYLQHRLEETMAEAKRHFSNYLAMNNMYNEFLESRLSAAKIQGGVKGQKIQSDILKMLKKNLEATEAVLNQEREHIKKSYLKL
jgi:hypothetical protein